MASSTVSENTEMQSSVRQAGTSPAVEISPRLGFSPTMLLSIAGTRPLPAVSVPSASGTSPADTATADPELDPPGIEIAAHRIDGNAIGRAHADEAGGELIEIGLADDDGAGRAQFCDRRRILRRHIGEGRAGGGGRHAQRVDIVFHRDGHAVKRKLRGILLRQRFGFRQRVLFVAQADEDGGIVVVADALIAARDGLRRRHGAGAVRGDDRGNGFSQLMPRPWVG